MYMFDELDNNRYLHKNNKNIPEEYQKYSLHIALERADKNKDWVVFKELYKISPTFLRSHLFMTSIFNYNYLDLPLEEQIDLFKI